MKTKISGVKVSAKGYLIFPKEYTILQRELFKVKLTIKHPKPHSNMQQLQQRLKAITEYLQLSA